MNYLWGTSQADAQSVPEGLELLRAKYTKNPRSFKNAADALVAERRKYIETSGKLRNRDVTASWNKERQEYFYNRVAELIELQRHQAVVPSKREFERRDRENLAKRVDDFARVLFDRDESAKEAVTTFLRQQDPVALFRKNANGVYVFVADMWEEQKKVEEEKLAKAHEAFSLALQQIRQAVEEKDDSKLAETKNRLLGAIKKVQQGQSTDLRAITEVSLQKFGVQDKHKKLEESFKEVNACRTEIRDLESKLGIKRPKSAPKSGKSEPAKQNIVVRFFAAIGNFFTSIFRWFASLFGK